MSKETETYRRRAMNELESVELAASLFRESLTQGVPVNWHTGGLAETVNRLGEELGNWKEQYKRDNPDT
jgi:hypothetical protein